MPLAFLMGRATEEIALRTTESLGGLLNATFGNAAELIIAVLLILEASRVADPETQSFFIQLVQASLIGSILGNLLLVMGLAFVWGGIHHSEQKYSETQVSSNGSLLLLSMIVLVIPTVFHSSVGGEGGGLQTSGPEPYRCGDPALGLWPVPALPIPHPCAPFRYGRVSPRRTGNDTTRLNHPAGCCDRPGICLLYTSPSPRDNRTSRMPSSA